MVIFKRSKGHHRTEEHHLQVKNYVAKTVDVCLIIVGFAVATVIK
jgi:hypothetical protein